MKHLDKPTVIYINRRTIEVHGGNFQAPDNLLNVDRLDYALEIVQSTVFGTPVYQEVWEVAAAYMFYIVTGHVFTDGNKRTGLEAALLTLGLNGLGLKKEVQTVEESGVSDLPTPSINAALIEITLRLAAGKAQLNALQSWFARNTVPKSAG